MSSLINTQDTFLTPSLAKTRGPSENHICSFIAPSIPRSWQFGANLGGEGQKLPPPPKIAVSGEELAVVEMMQKVAVVVEMMHLFAKVDAGNEVEEDHFQPRKSIEGSLNCKTSAANCRRVLVATWNFPFCVLPDCNPTLSPLSPDVWLFIPLRWRSVFQWAPCGAQEVTLGPAAVPSSPRFHHQPRISTRLYSCKR